MKKLGTLVGTLGLICWGMVSMHAHAQSLYRIVAPDGTVTYSDRPLATGAAPLTKANANANANANTTTLPYQLRQAVGKYPVVLYSGNSCTPCDGGRSLLNARGIPFTERTVTTRDDVDALKQQMGDDSLPHLTVGKQKLRGFASDEWQQYLSAAGYPTRSTLPTGYKNAEPSPLVAVKKREEPKPQEIAPEPSPVEEAPAPPADPNKPRGFVF